MALSLRLNKPQGLKYFAKLEPDRGPCLATQIMGSGPTCQQMLGKDKAAQAKTAGLNRNVCVTFQFFLKGTVWTLPQPQMMWIFVMAKNVQL